jgi:hypothetical protein
MMISTFGPRKIGCQEKKKTFLSTKPILRGLFLDSQLLELSSPTI